jgi:motility quorum-sensing regulator/GCU-specific mRNA interferase toxin
MEKGTPHCKLSLVHELIQAGKLRMTGSALAGAAGLGLGRDDIVDTAMALTSKDFYKSMTTYLDHRVWQDVYRPITAAGKVYLKLTVVDEVLIVSFKEL